MPSPTKFTLTPTRKAKMREMFENQHSLQSVAIQHGISYKHLSKILRKAKFDYKAIQMSGINNLRADVLKSIGKIDDPKDKATVGLKYLDKYDKDDAVDDEKTSGPNVDKITASIMLEMNGSD